MVFLTCSKILANEIINVVNSTRMNQEIENRAILKPIIKLVIFFGCQHISLRGHCDPGSLLDNENNINNSSIVNDKNIW